MPPSTYFGTALWAGLGGSAPPMLNGSLHHPLPADIGKTLHAAAAEKIREYRADFNSCPSHSISFMPAVATTSGRLHCELVRILFLQTHRETDAFLQLQELSKRNITRTSSVSAALISTPSSNLRLATTHSFSSLIHVPLLRYSIFPLHLSVCETLNFSSFSS